MLKTINSDGSLKISLIGSTVPSGAVYNDGMAYAPDGAMYVKLTQGALSGQVYNGGLACTPDGALYVTTDDPDSSSASRRGMLCRYDGAVHLADAGLSAISYSGGIPTDSAGALYCNVPEFVLNITHSAIPTRGNITPNFTRATTKTIPDNEGILRTLIAGELGFPGARRVRNLLTGTTTLSTQNVTTEARTYLLSFYGTGSVALSGTITNNLAGTGASNRVSGVYTATAGTLTLTVTGSVTSAQLEDITGRTDQTTPSEYVSVGVVQRNLCNYSEQIAAGFTFTGTCAGADNVASYGGRVFSRITNATGGAAYRATTYTGNGTKAFSCRLKQDGAVTGTYSVGNFDSTAVASRGYVMATIAADGSMTFAAVGGATLVSSELIGDGVYEVKGTFAGVVAANANFFYANFAVGTATSCLVSSMQTENSAASTEYQAVGNVPAYHGSMVDGVKCFPYDLDGTPLTTMTTPLIELAGTQILATADIRDMTTAAWILGATMTRARTSVGADGTPNSATRLTGGVVAATNTCYNTITAAASSRTYSAYVKRVTGTGPVRIVQTGTETDISSQLTTTGYTLVQLNASVLNVAIGFKIDTNGDAIDVDFNQFEAGTAATSPMAATGAARAADQLYYTGADIANIKTLAAIGFKRESGFANTGTIVALSDNTANETARFGMASATASTITGVDGGVTQWAMTPAAYSPGARVNFAQSFAANDVKGSYEGTTQTADTSATMPTVSRLEYGMLAGAAQLNGYPGKIYGWLSNKSQSELNAVTAQ